MAWNRENSPFLQTTRPKIAIGIPHTEVVTMEWSCRMLGPLLFIPTNWCDKVPQMARGVPQNIARDQIVEMTLKDPTITHILWVDTDNVCVSPPDPNVALQMLFQCNAPIASGLYRAKQAVGFNYAAWMDAKLPNNQIGFLPIQSFTGNWVQVDVIALGFCLVKREVYERIPKPWHPWPTATPSEDFNFCIAARKYGYSINLFTEVKLSHIGELQVMPDGTVKVLDI